MSRLIIAWLCLALTAACTGDAATPTSLEGVVVTAGEVSATRTADGVKVYNGTSTALAYAVSNPDWLGLLDACANPSPACVRLPAGSTVTVPFAEISGWDENADDAVVYWWYVLPNGDGTYRTSEIGEIVV